ncbi:hypothetical protein [Bradyrhizobium sp. CCGE-LA001]|uniref:hypothetical protein n=1 Tax=Bradyrhizobium sp. CCGE-LA001 TaxID=1223566 RepID=UPI0002AAA28F|nr:hypothetical protein [Bradyrhizobium sp. CCGE-LA001]AMA55745.1 hypothetical protein BCCGELA001_05340 [Bradyrhizobium sp. CCGE-LA001]
MQTLLKVVNCLIKRITYITQELARLCGFASLVRVGCQHEKGLKPPEVNIVLGHTPSMALILFLVETFITVFPQGSFSAPKNRHLPAVLVAAFGFAL